MGSGHSRKLTSAEVEDLASASTRRGAPPRPGAKSDVYDWLVIGVRRGLDGQRSQS